jgi:transaldolase/glucose-6-phosphate isomerase
VHREGDLSLFADLEVDAELARAVDGSVDLVGWLRAHLGRARSPDYCGIQAFVAPDEGIMADMTGIRRCIRDELGVATTFGWGPRFLHSTGQLHKGGPPTGVFLQITADDAADVDCPGRSYSFGVLVRAQALGDLQALQARGRRALRVHVSGDLRTGVERLAAAVEEALR